MSVNWIRKLQSETAEAACASDQVFHFNAADTKKPPVAICLLENIRIEVDTDCPARLMAALLQA